MSLLIKNVLLTNRKEDILVEGNRISRIAASIDDVADRTIDATDKAIIPGFANVHTHAAMTLFRGFGDDMPLMRWLEDKIWPNEAKLTEEDIYWGSKLACLEMIKSGTTSFLDMYSMIPATARAVEESGIRANLSYTLFDRFTEERAALDRKMVKKLHKDFADDYSERVQFSMGPHAIYTVSGKQLQWCHQYSQEHDLLIHLHLSETEGEVKECIKNYGTSPVRYLKELGVLSPNLVVAHGVWMDEDEIKILADYGISVVHNPASNMKLASGIGFQYDLMRSLGIKVGLGTDGCSSSNNLDMVVAMKIASLLGKARELNPVHVKADDIFYSATRLGHEILRIDAGRIEEGALADFSLVNLKTPAFIPNHNFVSNLVYSGNGNDIDTVVCDGKVLMEHRHVTGEEEIMERVAKIAYDLVNR